MTPDLHAYDHERDLAAVVRIWREVGWIDSDDHAEGLADFLQANTVEVGLIDGVAECAVAWAPGSIRYQATDLPLCVVTAVTTSRIARKHGFATALTARALASGAEAGAAVAALGMFEQGFYDRLGFASTGYSNRFTFDPATLTLDHVAYRPDPVRLSVDDWAEVHGLLARRHRGHGGVVLDPPETIAAELRWLNKPFGLGYRNPQGRLTHAFFGEAEGTEHGPYSLQFVAYEEPQQLLELLRLLKELGDQLHSVRMLQPQGIQLQDLIRAPIARARLTRSSPHEAGVRSMAWTQLRLLDPSPCGTARRWPGTPVTHNLRLTDPATPALSAEVPAGWGGVQGDYVVTIGDPSSIEVGHEPSRPTITSSVNAWSRCWFGVLPATSLALTDDLAGPPDLLETLDEALSLPPPVTGWEF